MYRTSKILENVLILIHLNTFTMNSTTCGDCVHCAPVYYRGIDRKGQVKVLGHFCDNPEINKSVKDSDTACEQFSPLEI